MKDFVLVVLLAVCAFVMGAAFGLKKAPELAGADVPACVEAESFVLRDGRTRERVELSIDRRGRLTISDAYGVRQLESCNCTCPYCRSRTPYPHGQHPIGEGAPAGQATPSKKAS